MHIGIGTGRFIYISILLTFDIPFIFYDADVMPIIDVSNVIAAANPEVDVTANDVEIPTFRSTFRSTIRPSLDVDKRVSVVRQKLWLRHEAGTTGSSSD
jgi:hypothetical protein